MYGEDGVYVVLTASARRWRWQRIMVVTEIVIKEKKLAFIYVTSFVRAGSL